MSLNKSEPISLGERIELIDVLRGLAVCGILIGNMQWFTGYGFVPPGIGEKSLADQVTTFFVHFVVEGKFYSIFSFLFGFGFALQIARADERGDERASVFKRRLFWLLVIGVLHASLLWAGDILSVYALMGFILLLFRKKSTASLLKWAVVLIAVPVVTYALLYAAFVMFVPAEVLANLEAEQVRQWNDLQAVASQGTYWKIISDFNLKMLAGRWAGLIVQMRLPKILAMFLLGLYAYRHGIFQHLSQNSGLIKKVLVYGLVLGIIGNIAMAALAGNEAPLPPSLAGFIGVLGYSFGVPALALAIIALAATAWQNRAARTVLSIVAPVGRMALTNYLLQTVICVTIFYGYGLEYYGRVGATTATLIALLIFAVQIIFSTVWLRSLAYGPMEWLWRQLTYRKRLELRRTAAV